MVKRIAALLQAICFSIAALLLATEAHAQSELVDSAVAHVGVGAGVNFYRPRSSEAGSSEGIGIAYRWHSFHSGWGPTFSLDWHSTDFHEQIGSVDAPFGSLRSRGLLAGFGHTKRLGRFTASASASGGYSFNTPTVDSGVASAFSRTGASLVSVGMRDSFIAKPDVAVWYDVFKHVGVGVSVAYLFNRPDQNITTASGSTVRQLNADTWELTTGVVLGVWKKKT